MGLGGGEGRRGQARAPRSQPLHKAFWLNPGGLLAALADAESCQDRHQHSCEVQHPAPWQREGHRLVCPCWAGLWIWGCTLCAARGREWGPAACGVVHWRGVTCLDAGGAPPVGGRQGLVRCLHLCIHGAQRCTHPGHLPAGGALSRLCWVGSRGGARPPDVMLGWGINRGCEAEKAMTYDVIQTLDCSRLA